MFKKIAVGQENAEIYRQDYSTCRISAMTFEETDPHGWV